jgi:hypothetical protein
MAIWLTHNFWFGQDEWPTHIDMIGKAVPMWLCEHPLDQGITSCNVLDSVHRCVISTYRLILTISCRQEVMKLYIVYIAYIMCVRVCEWLSLSHMMLFVPWLW